MFNCTYFNNTLFSGLSGDNFRFDSNGDGPARYNIIHYKQVKAGQYQWVNVGYFQDDKIQLNMDGKFDISSKEFSARFCRKESVGTLELFSLYM